MVDTRYAGPAYPFGATIGSVFGAKDSVSTITTSIVNILTTPKGSRPEDPNKGSVVPHLIFEILDDITLSLISYFTYKDLTEQEPRIYVRSVSAFRDGDHKAACQVGFSLIGDTEETVYGAVIRYDREQIGGL